ncbi:MAG: hypothetical protein IKB50_00260 [Clostridia bacterium]|nr:hypothetical protein [Clostridia bacterium]
MNKSNLLSGLDGDEKILISHVMDLAERCEKAGVVMYSPFLNPREYDLAVSRSRGSFSVKGFGGYDGAERKMIAFCPYEDDVPYYPITAIRITAKDGSVFSHRDYLGALLSLGLKREKVGDIVTDETCAIVFCDSTVADFICLNLDKVASRGVVCTACEVTDVVVDRKFDFSSSTVASMRLDCVLAAAIGKSRESISQLITRGFVQHNYEVADSVSARVSSGDTISARGYGKMIIETDSSTTRKGRIRIDIKRFV